MVRRKSPTKRAVNLSISDDLLREAKELGINISLTLEQSLAARVAEARMAKWLEDNRAALEAYNEHVDRDGVFSDGVRGF